MTLFIGIHQAPGLSEEELASYAPEVVKGAEATFKNLYANSTSGKIITLYEASDVTALESEFERLGFPFEEIHEIDLNLDHATLSAMVAL